MEIVNIGIAGLGTVGSEVAKQLQLNSEFLNKKFLHLYRLGLSNQFL